MHSVFKSCAEDKETVSGLYAVKEILLQSWRYKTLAVIKRHKNHLTFFILNLP